MDNKTTLEIIWQFVNSPAAVTAIASLLIWCLNKLYAKKPLWKKFEGSIISAVKLAEKEIPNDVENKALARLDAALRYVVKVFEEVEGREAKLPEIAELKEGIMATHAELEGKDAL